MKSRSHTCKMYILNDFWDVLSFSCLIFISLAPFVSPGANDLHFNEGSSSMDVIGNDVFFEILDPPELSYSFRIRPAKDFGANFNSSQHFERARLVPVTPLLCCTDIKNSEAIIGHIALAERGKCSFAHKATIAQQAGARAVIIMDSSINAVENMSDNLIEMIDDKNRHDVNIPAAFLLGRNGAKILQTLTRLGRSYAIINLPVNLTHVPISKMNQPPWVAW